MKDEEENEEEDQTEATRNGFYHEHRKLVLSLHFPAESKLQMQRIETEPIYGKPIFVQMRSHYKQKFERGEAVDDVVII